MGIGHQTGLGLHWGERQFGPDAVPMSPPSSASRGRRPSQVRWNWVWGWTTAYRLADPLGYHTLRKVPPRPAIPSETAVNRAVELIGRWCVQVHDHATLGPPGARAAELMLLCRSIDQRGLEDMARRGVVSPPPGRSLLFFFAGPCRRSLGGHSLAAAVALAAGADRASTAGLVTAAPFDTGGLRRHTGLEKNEEAACLSEWCMPAPLYRTYLGSFLRCAFTAPSDYLDDATRPTLRDEEPDGPDAERGFWKALRADASSWTVEVVMRPPQPGLDLAWLREEGLLDNVAVFGAENEILVDRLEQTLGAGLVSLFGGPTPLGSDPGSVAARARRAYQALSDWSIERQRRAWDA